jgi:hypothetical protein
MWKLYRIRDRDFEKEVQALGLDLSCPSPNRDSFYYNSNIISLILPRESLGCRYDNHRMDDARYVGRNHISVRYHEIIAEKRSGVGTDG